MASLTETFLRMGGPLGDYLGDQMRLRQQAMNAEEMRQRSKMAELEWTLRKKQQERIEKEHQIEALTKATGDFEKMIFDSAYTGGTMDEATAKGKWATIAKNYGVAADQLPAVDFNRLNDIAFAGMQKRLAEQQAEANKLAVQNEKATTEDLRRELIQARIDALRSRGSSAGRGTSKATGGVDDNLADKAEALISQWEAKYSASPDRAPTWTKGAPTAGELSDEQMAAWAQSAAEDGKTPKEFGVRFRSDIFRHKLPRNILAIPGMKPEWAQAWMARQQAGQAVAPPVSAPTEQGGGSVPMAQGDVIEEGAIAIPVENASYIKTTTDRQTGKRIRLFALPGGKVIAEEVE